MAPHLWWHASSGFATTCNGSKYFGKLGGGKGLKSPLLLISVTGLSFYLVAGFSMWMPTKDIYINSTIEK